MGAIDVGTVPADFDSSTSQGWTQIDKSNPANLSGLITSVQVSAAFNVTGLRVGTFYLVSGLDYKCRASQNLGAVTVAESPKTIACSIAIEAGDFIGSFCTIGALEKNNSGGSGALFITSEHIDPGDQATYTAEASRKIALYGTGVTLVTRGWMSK